MTAFIALFHQRQAKGFNPFTFHGKTNEAAAIFRHEIDGFRCRKFCQDTDITFIFTIFVVNKDEDFTIFSGCDDLFC